MIARAGWRAADLRGDGPVPPSVGAVVRRTWLALLAARWGESALFFAAGFLVTLAVAELGLADPTDPDRYGVALVAGLCAGLAWGLERRATQREVARRLDRRLRHDGALVCAWELEARARGATDEPPLLAELLRARVLARLRLRDALRATQPSLALPLAAPLAAAGLLLVARETRRAEVPPPLELGRLSERGAELVSAAWLDVLDREDGLADRQTTVREFAAVERAMRDLAHRAPDGDDPEELARWSAELEELDRRLSELSHRLAGWPQAVEALEAARTTLDAARMEAARGEEPPGGLVATAEGGTMTGSPGTSKGSATPPAEGDAADRPEAGGETAPGALPGEVGAGAGRWWRPRHDPVVARWIELRRRALSAPDESE